jgi:hypothetical protein
MRYVPILLLLAAACNSTKQGDPPVGTAKTNPNAEFAKFRPNAIAVLRVDAPNQEMRLKLRRQIYDGLFNKKYACLRLPTVDAHTNSKGEFEGGSLDWDATFKVNVGSWMPIVGGRYYAATGSARMVHRSGELLWERTFASYPFEVEARAGKTHFETAYRAIVDLILRELPERPPIPRE